MHRDPTPYSVDAKTTPARRILLVDDEPQLLFSVREFLSRLGYEVVAAESGSEALGMLIQAPPDVIISDIIMEGMDGFEFQKRVNALTGETIPFIFLTARGDLEDRLQGLRSGADDYVVKPFEPEELEARVAAVFNRIVQTRREERRETEALRGRILAEVSRQLRAPVTGIMAQLNLLLSERFGEDQEMQERYLRNALEDASALGSLIHDLSWAAADAARELPLKREPIRVAPVVRGAAASAARLAGKKGVALKMLCGGLLSANMDGDAMSRALAGLLESVVKISPPGGQVQITARRARESGVEFTITDDGYTPGANGSQNGSQLSPEALDFARRVVKGHGGEFSTRRAENNGHSIVIWLPGRVAKHIGRRK